MSRIRPEAFVRWLDDLDCVAFALRTLWHGARGRRLCTALAIAGLATLFVLSPVVAG